MSPTELAEIVRKHGIWLSGEDGGTRAVLTRADLRDADLTGADLTRAVLRDAVLTRAVLRDAVLTRAALTGADLTRAALTGADLRGAILTDAVLTRAILTDAVLTRAVLRDAVLTDADLTGAILTDAILTGAILTGADLNAGIPKIERLHSKILAAIEGGGTLEMVNWHTCDTTHCRAGWAIQIAGEFGRGLEWSLGSSAAGALLFAVAYPEQKVPDFYASNSETMEDIRRCAAAESEGAK